MVVTSFCGDDDTTNVMTLNVYEKPQVNLTEEFTACTSDAVAFPSNVLGTVTSSQWYFNDEVITPTPKYGGVNTTSLTINDLDFQDEGTYTLVASNQECMVDSSTYLTVRSVPVVTQIYGFPEVCQTDLNVKFFGVGLDVDTYSWDLVGTINATLDEQNDTVFVSWNGEDPGVFTLQAQGTNICGTGSFYGGLVRVESLPEIVGQLVGEDTVCNNSSESFTLNTTSDLFDLVWQSTYEQGIDINDNDEEASIFFDADEIRTEHIYVFNSNSCGLSMDSITKEIVILPPLLEPQKPVGDTEVCVGVDSTLVITNSIPFATTYEWDVFPNSAGTIVGSDTAIHIVWSDGFDGDVDIDVRAENACQFSSISEELEIEVLGIPDKPSRPSGDNSFCQGEEFTLYSVFPSSQATNYHWIINDAVYDSLIISEHEITIYWDNTYSGDISIATQYENACGMSDTSNAREVTIEGLPIADFSFDEDGFSNTVDFINLSLDADDYYWNFGETDPFDNPYTSTFENPFHSYFNEQPYDILLIASNDCGQDSIIKTVFGPVTNTGEGLSELMVYPTLFDDRLTITGNLMLDNVYMYSSDGKSVKTLSYQVGEDNVAINTQSTAKGLYYVKIISDKGSEYVFKVVKQ